MARWTRIENAAASATLGDGLMQLKAGFSGEHGGFIAKVKGRGRVYCDTNNRLGYDTIAEAQNAALEIAAKQIEAMMGEVEALREQAAESADA